MPSTPPTRPSLLVRLHDHADSRAWAEFVEIYGPFIRRVARRMGMQAADAEDLEQEVFRAVAAAGEHAGYDRSRGSFRGWLFRVARNLAVNALVARGRHPRGTGDTDMVRLLDEQPAPELADVVETEYRTRMLEWAAERVRGEFSDAAWGAFWATAVEGRPAPEVAAGLGLSVGSVYNAKSRVMARLRREVERAEGERGLDPGEGSADVAPGVGMRS
jgi:RNA polymerase sigma-70 factor (ECF subfamily)